MKFAHIGGVDVRIHPVLPLFVIVAVWLGFGATLATALTCLFLHEAAHVIAARLCGVEVERLELTPFGGVARMDALLDMRPSAEIVIALAGPAVNLIAAMALSSIREWFDWPIADVAPWISANLALAMINLTPVLPLDGGRMVRAALSKAIGFPRATRWAAGAGFLAGLALTGYVVYLALGGPINLSLLSVALCMTTSALREWRQTPFLAVRDISRKREMLHRERTLSVRHLAALGDVSVEAAMRRFRPQRYHFVTVLSPDGRSLGTLDESALLRVLLDGRGRERLDALTSRGLNDTFPR